MREFEVRAERARVDVPIDLVWNVLAETESCGKWNPFTPELRTDLKIGSPARLRVRMGPIHIKITETVCAFEKPRLIAWTKTFGARWLLVATRQQVLNPMNDDELLLPQLGSADRLARPGRLGAQRKLHALRLSRRGRRVEAICGSAT